MTFRDFSNVATYYAGSTAEIGQQRSLTGNLLAWDLLMKRLLFICIMAVCSAVPARPARPLNEKCESVPARYLLSAPVTVSDVERQKMAELPEMLKFRSDFPRVPFGFANAKWTAFKSKVQSGDKIVEFTTDTRSWQHSAGESGYALIRSGCLIGTFVTMRN